jgi:hypothetical protein
VAANIFDNPIEFGRLEHRHVFAGCDRKHAIESGGSTKRSAVWPHSGDPDGDARLLDRNRQKGHLVEVIVAAVKRKRLTGPQSPDDLESFVEHLRSRSLVNLLTKSSELGVRWEPDSHSQDEATTAQLVKRNGFPG